MSNATSRRRSALWVSTAVALVTLAGPPAAFPASGQGTPPAPPAAAGFVAPWPVLPDGRVVFTVYGIKVAMPTCPRCLDYEFANRGPALDPDVYKVVGRGVRVRDAIANPQLLRLLEASTSSVELRMGNSWLPEVNKGPFLGRFDPRSLPRTAELILFLERRSEAVPCWEGPPHAWCLGVHDLDVSGRQADQVVAGMSVTKGFYTRDYPQARGTSSPFMLSGAFYLAPPDHSRDAVGLPVRFLCRSLGSCRNSESGVEGGFALRPNTLLNFGFEEKDYAPENWVAMHDRVAAAVGSLLVD